MAETGDIAVKVLRLRAEDADLPLPRYATSGSAGMDLHAAVREPLVLAPGERAMVPTGLALQLPAGFEGQVRPRSGLAAKHGLTLLNSPGTIDADYRGEVRVILVNLGREPYTVERGHRVAQLVVAPVAQARIVEVEGLDSTERSDGGFGSSGT